MGRPLSIFGAILRKDIRLFWQFAALISALIVLWEFPSLVARLGPLAGIVRASIPFAGIILILVVLYEDAVMSVKHDWLARPISGTTLLLAKCTFILLAIVAPSVLGGIAGNLYEGRSVGEAVLAGVSSGASGGSLTLLVIVMAFAALTGSIRQAIVVFLAGMAVLAVLALMIFSVLGVRGLGEAIGSSGSVWVMTLPITLALTLVAVSVLWMQYRYRHTRAAQIVVGAAVIAGTVFLALMNWPRIFAVQKWFAKDPAAQSAVLVELAKGCFPARDLEMDRGDAAASAAAGITGDLYSEDQRKSAGPGAIAFATQLILRSLPEGDRLTLGPALLVYRTAGSTVSRLYPGRVQWKATDEGLLAANHYWLLPRSEFQRLAALGAVQMHISYSMSLLAPTADAEFLADGRRQFYPGIGYCGATFDRATGFVDVDCFKAGAQPAQLVAGLNGAPEIESKASDWPDFTPAALNFWGGKRHAIQLRAKGNDVPRVNVTALEARAHFDRRLVVPGVLGGPVSGCPAP